MCIVNIQVYFNRVPYANLTQYYEMEKAFRVMR